MKTLWTVREKYSGSAEASFTGSHESSLSHGSSGRCSTGNRNTKELCAFSPLEDEFKSRTTSAFATDEQDDGGQLNFSVNNVDIGRYFPGLPKEEVLARSFRCSCATGVVRSGKLCVTDNFILFYSPMMEGGIKISFNDVSTVEKERKMTILDGLTITKKDGEFLTFTNFVSRDAAFNMLIEYLSKVKDKSQAVVGSSDEGPLTIKTSTCSDSIADIPPASSIDEFSSIETEYGTAFSDYSCFTKEIITPVELPTGKTVIDVFAACFDDGQPLLEKYHTERGDVDQQWENWRPIPRGKSFCGQRKFVCTTLVKAMMNKPYSFYEYQRYGFLNVNGTPTLLLQFSSQVPGVMFGESFRVEALSVFSQEGEGESAKVTMRAYCYVQFLKSVWVKGKINSTSQSEQSESYKKISQMIVTRLKAVSASKETKEHDSDSVCPSPSRENKVSPKTV
ncbi:hypothetical protein AGDE_04704 [Angomonas deanei]|uniref:GRAM domain/VAD1 Analog of StAR-related lipid transfer domain containing protein, putative n=1 Tax=Angomonas deanei TaxID=59799 RepID=A0A7G2CTD9_9TRYP|nr:hypothetical protein AGDE_04704 [Angomonas deanei]CAD2221703.1 GRAM domain/VAD1 Analog of StAR-related lipid transfer domain containing protein, putative [Angomonas deanei]|eukprot:EPY39224.1 hypothetical protein AGDE_04704 [Angomonas deanei]